MNVFLFPFFSYLKGKTFFMAGNLSETGIAMRQDQDKKIAKKGED